MSDLSKKMKKQLHELVSIAYTRELNYHLGQLAQKFDEWRKNEIDCWALGDFIHKFHDGISRDLYKTYNYGASKLLLISRALNLGFLNKDEISNEVLGLVGS